MKDNVHRLVELTEDLVNIRGVVTHRKGSTLSDVEFVEISRMLSRDSFTHVDGLFKVVQEPDVATLLRLHLQYCIDKDSADIQNCMGRRSIDGWLDRLLTGHKICPTEHHPMDAVKFAAFAFYGRRIKHIDEDDPEDVETLKLVMDAVIRRANRLTDITLLPFLELKLYDYSSAAFQRADEINRARMVRSVMAELTAVVDLVE